jgi:putative ABC transport system permease protein
VPGRLEPTEPVSSESLPIFNGVDPSFFTVLRMRLIRGRFFTDAENHKDAQSVAVITESMARNLWPGEDAVGKCFYMGGPSNPCTEVVGLVADARLFPSIRPTKEWTSACYVPIEQGGFSSSRALLVRTAGDLTGMLQALRREAQEAAPDLPYVDAHAFDDIFEALLRPWRLGSVVFVVFGALSIVIAAVGLAAVGAHAVTRRTQEIGIRSALGAEPIQLIRLVLSRSVLVIAAGIAAGMGFAWAAGRILNAQLFGVTAAEPRVLAAAAFGTLVIGTLAAWVPARRAARIDPVIALRAE